jgi:hypothetical protein
MERRKTKNIVQKTIKKTPIKRTISKNIDTLIASLFKRQSNIPLTAKEEKDALLAVYKKFPDIDLIIKKTRLPATRVNKFLGYHTLIRPLQEKVDTGEISVQSAIYAQKALCAKKRMNGNKAIEYAKAMTKLPTVKMQKMVKIIQLDPTLKTSKIIELVNQKRPLKQVTKIKINDGTSDEIIRYGKRYPNSLIALIFKRIIKQNHRIVAISITSKSQ